MMQHLIIQSQPPLFILFLTSLSILLLSANRVSCYNNNRIISSYHHQKKTFVSSSSSSSSCTTRTLKEHPHKRAIITKLKTSFSPNMEEEQSYYNTIEDDKTMMPWSDIQEWALKDNLPKYTINVMLKDTKQMYSFALWNTMLRDIPELTGYDISFLRSKLQHNKNDVTTPAALVPEGIPFMTNFQFERNGGMQGIVFNLPGIADGTTIHTDALKDVYQTLPRGYIQTASDTNSIFYELGYALGEDISSSSLQSRSSTLLQSLSSITTSTISNMDIDKAADIGSNTMDLVKNAGGITAIALGSATAFHLLTHHLTVNVFWV